MTREYPRVMLYIAVSLLLIVPLVWLAQNSKVQAMLPWLAGSVANVTNRLQPAENKVPEYRAELIGQSHTNLRIQADEELRIWIDFKNTGTKAWKNDGEREFIALNTSNPQDRESLFRTAEWEYKPNTHTYRPGRMSHGYVEPGDVGRFYLHLHAPDKPGTYTENFKLVSEWREWVGGGEIAVTITVTPSQRVASPAKRGDWLRVGVHKPDNASDPIKISANGAFEVRDSQNNLIALYNQNEVVSVQYLGGKYRLRGPATPGGEYNPTGWQQEVMSYLRFIPKNQAVLKVVSLEERPPWNNVFNYNRFLGDLYVRHAEKTGNTWVINQVPMEAYLRGTHEVSDYDQKEMIKAFIVAERSFAQNLIDIGGKYYNGNFDISRWATDQVYHGYNYELQSPNISQAVNETAGEMITYDGEVVTTPYFTQSDGKTRSNEEVWGSVKPWLVAVDDPGCAGEEMYGHGVGMSGKGVKYFAEEGKNYREILGHYYRGIVLNKAY